MAHERSHILGANHVRPCAGKQPTHEPTQDNHMTDTFDPQVGALQPIIKLNRAMLKAMASDMPGGVTDNEARYLVDTYYTIQKARIRNVLQSKGLDRDAKKTGNDAEPHEHLDHFARDFGIQEENIKRVLGWYVETHSMAWFFRSEEHTSELQSQR